MVRTFCQPMVPFSLIGAGQVQVVSLADTYSRCCELYTRWKGKLSLVMRQLHRAGERLFVDYASQTVDVRTAQMFVTTLIEQVRCLGN